MFDKPEPQKMWAANCSNSYYRIIHFLFICVHVFMYVTLFVAIVLGHQYNNTRLNFTI
jgi:hypothetical protein